MTMLHRPAFRTGGKFGSPKIDLGGCVFYAPLWRPNLAGSTFQSSGVYGTPVSTCTVTGATWGSQGRSFDGDDKISVAQSAALQNLTAKSVFIWHKTPAFTASARYLYDDGYFETNFGVRIFAIAAANNINIWIKNSAGTLVAEEFAFTANAFELVGFTWDGTTVHYYSNAVEKGAGDALTGTIAASDDTLTLGATTPTNVSWYNGTEGEVWIYNRALTAAEVSHIYQVTKWRYQ